MPPANSSILARRLGNVEKGTKRLRERGLREPTPVRVLNGSGFHLEAVVPLYKPSGIPLLSSGIVSKLVDASGKQSTSSSKEGLLSPKDLEDVTDVEDSLLFRVLDSSPAGTGTTPSIAFPTYRHSAFSGKIPSGSTRLQQQTALQSAGSMIGRHNRVRHEVISTSLPEWYRGSNAFHASGVSLSVISRGLESFYSCAFRNGAMRSTYHVLCRVPRGVKAPMSARTTAAPFSSQATSPASRIGQLNPAFANSNVIQEKGASGTGALVEGAGGRDSGEVATVTRTMAELVSDGAGGFVPRGSNFGSTPLISSALDWDPKENPLAYVYSQRQSHITPNDSATLPHLGPTWTPHIEGDHLFRGEYLVETGTIRAAFNNLPIIQSDELYTLMASQQKLISLFAPPAELSSEGRAEWQQQQQARIAGALPEFWLDYPGAEHPFLPKEALLGLQPWSVTRRDIVHALTTLAAEQGSNRPQQMPRWLWAWLQGAVRRASASFQLVTFNPLTRIALYEIKSTSLDEHQLRALMARCGAPVVGDVAYNEELAAAVALSHRCATEGLRRIAEGASKATGRRDVAATTSSSPRPIFQAMSAAKKTDAVSTAATWAFQPHPLLSGIATPSELRLADGHTNGRATLFENPLRTVVLPFSQLRHACRHLFTLLEDSIASEAFTDAERDRLSSMPDSTRLLVVTSDILELVGRMWNCPQPSPFNAVHQPSPKSRIQRLEAAVYSRLNEEAEESSSLLPQQGLSHTMGVLVKCFHTLACVAHAELTQEPNTKFPNTRAVAALGIGSGLALTKLQYPSPQHPINASRLQNMELSRQLSSGGASAEGGGSDPAILHNKGGPKDTADSFISIVVTAADGDASSEGNASEMFVPSSLRVASKMKPVLPPLLVKARDSGRQQVVASVLPPSALFSNEVGVLAALEDVRERLTRCGSPSDGGELMGSVACPEAVTAATELMKTIVSMSIAGGLGQEEVGQFYCAGCNRYGDHPTKLCKGSPSHASEQVSLEQDEARLLSELRSIRNGVSKSAGVRRDQILSSSLSGTPVETDFFATSRGGGSADSPRLSIDAIFSDSFTTPSQISDDSPTTIDGVGVRSAKDHHEAAMRALEESANTVGGSLRHVEIQERREKIAHHIQLRNEQLPHLHQHRVSPHQTSPVVGLEDPRRRQRCAYCFGTHLVDVCPKLGSGEGASSSADLAAWAGISSKLSPLAEGTGNIQIALKTASEKGFLVMGSSGSPRVLLSPKSVPAALATAVTPSATRQHSITAALRATLSKPPPSSASSKAISPSLESFDISVFTDAVLADPRVVFCIRCGSMGHFHEVCPTLPQGFAVVSPLHSIMRESAQKVLGRTSLGGRGDGVSNTLKENQWMGGGGGKAQAMLNSRDHCTVCLGRKAVVAHEPHQCPKRVTPRAFQQRYSDAFKDGESQYYLYHPCGVHLKYTEEEGEKDTPVGSGGGEGKPRRRYLGGDNSRPRRGENDRSQQRHSTHKTSSRSTGSLFHEVNSQ